MSSNYFFLFLFLFTACTCVYASPTESRRDSIGVEKKGKNWLVLHKVTRGETISALARRYRTTVSAIQAENPALKKGLQSGVVIKVPFKGAVPESQTAETKATPQPSMAAGTHTVASKQGLYSIARMYNVSVEELKQWNNLPSDEIKEGQVLVVKADKAAQSATNPPPAVVNDPPLVESPKEKNVATKTPPAKEKPAVRKTHKVKSGQSLTTIARKYHVSVQDLRKWNRLSKNTVKPGQVLFVSRPVKAKPQPEELEEAAETSTAEAGSPTNETEPVASAETNPRKKPASDRHSSVKDREGEANESNNPAGGPYVVNTSGYTKTVESGLAEVINETDESELFLALHRTAPVGTILQVRNQMNDLSVFVKVIGKLPDTGSNDKLVVKVSRKAYERLAGVDKRFRVEVSYMP